jgi:hypothetical protein
MIKVTLTDEQAERLRLLVEMAQTTARANVRLRERQKKAFGGPHNAAPHFHLRDI